ncbi:MAG: hypothetical protein HQL64_17610 [Magnetococcales bacterium]|nr:hypothetical protein [Magnetococcales bacterium]
MDHSPPSTSRRWILLQRAAGLAGLALLSGCLHTTDADNRSPEHVKMTPDHVARIARSCVPGGLIPCAETGLPTIDSDLMLAAGEGSRGYPVMTSPNTIVMPRRVWRPMQTMPIVERITPVYPFPPGSADMDAMDDGVRIPSSRRSSSSVSSRAVPKLSEVREEGLDAPGYDLSGPGSHVTLPQPPGGMPLPPIEASPLASGQGTTPLPIVSGFGAADPDGRLLPTATHASTTVTHAPAGIAHAPAPVAATHAPAVAAHTPAPVAAAPAPTGETHAPAPAAAHASPPKNHAPPAEGAALSPYKPGGWPAAETSPPTEKPKPAAGKPKTARNVPNPGSSHAKKGDHEAVEVVEDVSGKKGANIPGSQPHH